MERFLLYQYPITAQFLSFEWFWNNFFIASGLSDRASQELIKYFNLNKFYATLDARGLLVRQQRGASERVVLVGERPLAQAVKYFERADSITLPFISPESKFEPGNLIGRLKKRSLKGLLLVKCAMILAKQVLPRTVGKTL